MRVVAAHEVARLISYRGLGVTEACTLVVREKPGALRRRGGPHRPRRRRQCGIALPRRSVLSRRVAW
jgi:hypothetical protein